MTTPTGSAPGRTADPLVPRDFGSWLSCLAGVVRRSWRAMLAVLALGFWISWAWLATLVNGLGPAVSMWAIAGGRVSFAPENVWCLSVTLIREALVWGTGGYLAAVAGITCVRVATAHASGREVSLRAVYRASLRPAWPLLGWSVLAGLCIAVGFAAY